MRKVQIRVNDAARLKEVLDGGGVPVPALRNPDDEDTDANGRNREASVDEITVDDRTETWQPSR